jgi:UDP-N-acetylglucosamine acyltransferase
MDWKNEFCTESDLGTVAANSNFSTGKREIRVKEAMIITTDSHPFVHPTAIIDPSAQIDPTVTIGAYSIIGPQVTIGANCIIGPHVVISRWTRMGARNRIFQFATIGEDCQDLKYGGEETWLEIGNDNTIRESCTFHRGTTQDRGLTKVGNNNLFMVNTHIAHDCMIGDGCVFANNVGIAGHVKVGDSVIVGGNSGIHQFCRLDAYSMVGGASLIVKDVPAYVMVSGNPSRAHGMNFEGMRRRGSSAETISALKQAFKIVYRQGLTTDQAIEALMSDILPQHQEVQLLIDSLQSSSRGITR